LNRYKRYNWYIQISGEYVCEVLSEVAAFDASAVAFLLGLDAIGL
jgi:hypothetical protein